ncbi:DUF4395 family protein [Clostridium bowmanii]|uniref:DUF4395 family protein n=1 Tax=Clostridium bowmanii TaxID=132925 RepID=UPI001C0B113F|nr:DUF4395 family protein [Clostridium bowmanii]MBU3190358.1 DUF4395 family protein [Clostridium bowmanii]MCA1074870.1 DUF4395 family protein [Clostridium bowmanii]
MKECRPVAVSHAAFNFCKYTMASIFWLALIFQNKLLVVLGFSILILSAIFKVKDAPLVFLYTHTINRIYPSKIEILDEKAVCFAHIVGATMSGIALMFLYFIHPLIGWILTGVLAILKTSASFGFCGAMKLYSCLNNPKGQCCRIGKKVKQCKIK